MPTWLITGASRGLGLAYVQQLITSAKNTVFAACRNPESAQTLRALSHSPSKKGTLYITKLDVIDEASIFTAQREVETILGLKGLDYLINNAGVALKDDLASNLTISDLVEVMKTNVGGPALVTRVFSPLVERSDRKVIVNISSTLGSIGNDMGRGDTTYSISKAALNMLTYKQQEERPDLVIFAVHPGWCRTDMGGKAAPHGAADGARKVLRILEGATSKDSGKFVDEEGRIIPW